MLCVGLVIDLLWSTSLVYFERITEAHRLSGLVKVLQASFESIVIFLCRACWIPRPLSGFRIVILSQLSRWSLRLEVELPHMKFLWIWSILPRTLLGSFVYWHSIGRYTI